MNIDNLKNNRDDILKAEIGSLLFLIEKTFLSWWKNNYFNSQTPLYDNRNLEIKSILESSFRNIKIDVSKLMTNYNQNQNEINLWQHFFKDWRKWRGRNKNNITKITSQLKVLQKLYGSAEGLNSGIEKGSPKENIQGDTPWISNSFGTFKLVTTYNLFDEKRDLLKNNIIILLDKLSTNFDFDEDRKNFFEIIESLYKNLPSDTRYPLNDVTLWNQAYMATSMFKALLSGIYLKPIDTNNYDLLENKWSILSIQYDKLALAEKGLKPAHIKTYREISQNIDLKLKYIIENKYALGNEIYRDETGIYFLVSEHLKGIENDEFYELHTDLDEVKNEILRVFYRIADNEFYPTILLNEPTRATMNLTTFLQKANENFLKADYSIKKEPLNIDNPIGVCQVCNNQFTEKIDNEVQMCSTCIDRKKGRIKEWLNNQDNETIWLDELGDKNNRVALVTLKFELMEWLNGSLFSSLLGQKNDLESHIYQNYIDDIFTTLKNNKKLDETILIQDYSENIPKDKSLREITESWFLERAIGTIYEQLISDNIRNNIDFQRRSIIWENLSEFISKLLLQFLLRKNPSPARLRRVWESTENFFEDIKTDVLDSIKATRKKDEFLKLIEDFPQNYKNRLEDNKEYKQYFSIIDPTPISWQFIIPTEKLEDTINKIQKLYYQNFKYVNGKLPLHIGIVVQNYKKPLYIGIKALRDIRRDIKSWSDIKTDEKLKNLEEYYKEEEKNNNSQDFYSLYETDNQEYDFSLLPSGKGVKKYNSTDDFIIYPNTIDFEFLDTNSRRNDIFYKEGKRLIDLKSNRPYSWSEWEDFKNFRDYFRDKSNQLQTVISLIYSKMQDWKDNEDSFQKFIKTTFEKDNIDTREFGLTDYSFKDMKKFLDMFAYYHTMLKEI